MQQTCRRTQRPFFSVPFARSLKGLPRPTIDVCREIAAHLRDRHGAFYQRTADETEALLAEEVDAARAEDLGTIDTFRFEEGRVLTDHSAFVRGIELHRLARVDLDDREHPATTTRSIALA